MRTINAVAIALVGRDDVVLRIPSVEGDCKRRTDFRIRRREIDRQQIAGPRDSVDRYRVQIRIFLTSGIVDMIVVAIVKVGECRSNSTYRFMASRAVLANIVESFDASSRPQELKRWRPMRLRILSFQGRSDILWPCFDTLQHVATLARVCCEQGVVRDLR